MKISVIRARVVAAAATLTVAATLAAVPASFAGASTKTAASGSTNTAVPNSAKDAAAAKAKTAAAASTVTLPDVLDTWENSLEPTTNYDADTDLQIGKSAYGNVTRSFLKFDVTAIKHRSVTSATLSLWQHGSAPGRCGHLGAPSLLLGSGQLSGGTTWNTQPPITDPRLWASWTDNVGSQCNTPGGVNIDITELVQAWANNAEPTYETLALGAGDETDATMWKMYYSANTFLAPHITVTLG
jgi:hypothetical protein